MRSDGLHSGEQFGLVERLGDEVVRAQGQTLHLRLWPRQAGQDQHRRVVAGDPHPPHDFKALDVGQHQVEQHDVVVIMAGELEAFLAGVNMIDHGATGFQHQNNAAGCDEIVFDKQNAHQPLP